MYKRVVLLPLLTANNGFGLYASGTLFIVTGGATTANLPLPQTGYQLTICNLTGNTLTFTGGFSGTLTTTSSTLLTGKTVTMIYESTAYGWITTSTSTA